MIDVEVPFQTETLVPASPDDAWALLSDIARSGGHFPGVDHLTAVDGQGRWRWTLKEKGLGPVRMRVVYDAVYEADPAARTVAWRPAPGRNDMDSYGRWSIVPDGAGCRLRFEARTVAHVPAPRLMKGMVEAFATEEIRGLKQQYVRAIARTLGA